MGYTRNYACSHACMQLTANNGECENKISRFEEPMYLYDSAKLYDLAKIIKNMKYEFFHE